MRLTKIVQIWLNILIVIFLEKYKDVSPKADATINTESPAWGVDRLSILALKFII